MASRFKVETENGLIDVYEEKAYGGLRVAHGDINVNAILVAWDVNDEPEIPTLTEFVIERAKQLNLFEEVA